MATLPEPHKTAARLRAASPLRPTLAIVLGSGFGSLTDAVEIYAQISYSKLSGFRPAGVGGHRGELLFASVAGVPLLLLSGRTHYYEGHSMEVVGFPIRVLAALGIQALVLTNAAGGINRRYRPGEFMVFSDHINLMGANPLRGAVGKDEARFVDLTRVYDSGLTGLLKRAGRAAGVSLHRGVYLAVSGPSYETPAEIRAFARLGADAVGMSAVPEAIVARQCGIRVAAVSCITNRAAGLSPLALSHADVLARMDRVRKKTVRWLTGFVELYAKEGRA